MYGTGILVAEACFKNILLFENTKQITCIYLTLPVLIVLFSGKRNQWHKCSNVPCLLNYEAWILIYSWMYYYYMYLYK